MKLQEYQSKELLAKYGVPVPKGHVCETPEQVAEAITALGGKGVVKAQVLAGGRGKAGGVKVAKSAEEGQAFAASILGKALYFEQAKQDLTIDRVLVEDVLPIAKEYYLGLTSDRTTQRNVFIVSSQGGMDIEEVAHSHPDAIGRYPVDPFLGVRDFSIRQVASEGGIPATELAALAPFLKKLYQAYTENDASLMEINPLVVTASGEFIAGDAKIVIDDNALFRHPDFAVFARNERRNRRIRKRSGQTGHQQLRPLGRQHRHYRQRRGPRDDHDGRSETGRRRSRRLFGHRGGAKAELVKNSLELVLSDPNVKGVLFNIFGGITRGDEVARGIIEGVSTLNVQVPIVVRLAGTNAEQGLELLKSTDLIPAATMQEAAQKIVSLVGSD